MADHVQGVVVYFGHDDTGFWVMREGSDQKELVDESTWKAYVAAGQVPQPRKNGDAVRLRLIDQVRVDMYAGDIESIPEHPETHPQHIKSVLLAPDSIEFVGVR